MRSKHVWAVWLLVAARGGWGQEAPILRIDSGGHTGEVGTIAFAADGTRLFTQCKADQTVRVWDLRTGRTESVLRARIDAGHQTGGDGLGVLDGGQRLVVALQERGVQPVIYDVRTARIDPARTFEPVRGATLGAALSADGRLFAAFGYDGTITIWATDTGKVLRTLGAGTNFPRCVGAAFRRIDATWPWPASMGPRASGPSQVRRCQACRRSPAL